MPFKLHIYLGAFVTYCDPILVYSLFQVEEQECLKRSIEAERMFYILHFCIKCECSYKPLKFDIITVRHVQSIRCFIFITFCGGYFYMSESPEM